MDVWSWVWDAMAQLRDDGHARLAELMQEIPGVALDGDEARTEAMCAEALALAAGAGQPWIPVYVRHWRLQGRASVRGQGAVTLTEAVDALDAAHLPEAAGCPQAVCTVQDLAICYGRADGPGWGNERIAVVEETLARITPAWPCWRCLHDEWALALVDLGRPDDALEKLARLPGGRDELEILPTKLAALLAAGRPEEAVSVGERYLARTDRGITAPRRVELGTLVALALARLGRTEEALARLPKAAETNLDDQVSWVRAAEALVAAGALPNDAWLGAQVWSMVDAQRESGCWFDAVVIALAYVRLALGRGRSWVARRGVEAVEELLPRLRDLSPVAAEVDDLHAAVAAARPAPVALPDDPAELLPAEERAGDAGPDEAAPEEVDPEEALDRWDAAYRRWPDDPRVAEWYARALLASGHRLAALAVLEEFVRRVPEDHGPSRLLGGVLLDPAVPDTAAVTALADLLRERAPMLAEWVLARLAQRTGDWAGCVEHCARLVEADPAVANTRRLLAYAARRAGDHDRAVEVLGELRALGEWTTADDWDLLVAATPAGRWDVVRETAARLGMTVEPGDGPIDEEWHYLLIRYDRGDDAIALRTGPVTARIERIPFGDEPMRYGDVVVFDPAPADPPPAKDDERLVVFRHLLTLTDGGYRGFEIEGRDPGPDAVAALGQAVTEAGWVLRVFEMTDPPEDPAERTLYAVLAVPPGLAPADVHRFLLDRTAAWPSPVGWPALAGAAGDPETAARQAEELDQLWDED